MPGKIIFMQKLGYIRVSTCEQSPDRQIDRLEALCDELFVEYLSAATTKRPILQEVLSSLSAGDILVILDLDRAFRSTIDALETLEMLKGRGVALKIVNMNLDTTTPSGMLIYTMISAFAEFERRINSQRTKEGLEAARNRGVTLGRPRKLSAEDLEMIRVRLQRDDFLKDIAADYDMAPWSLTRALKRHAYECAASIQ
ncbi:recombinase family protein [Parvularcula marina]|uniref:Recombinase family protein n=1 Tax=Parvularcula marina TaxID=2292771 RepID=A0A371RFQ0_9PROT|nr:recombinase family protein [Parvularcula marina]RFB04278.1 recombinase family protein [Parvularcula marina]